MTADWPTDDFDITLRPDPTFEGSTDRASLEHFLSNLRGVGRNGEKGFVLDTPAGRWMEITPQTRRWDGVMGEVVSNEGANVNCVHLFFPGTHRGPELERDYWHMAFRIAEHLGWLVFDDTDSGSTVSRETLEFWYPSQPIAPKPWWKLW